MEIVSGFLVGIMGSAHCAGMCGPIALALPTGGKTGWPLLAGRVMYNAGRIVTYALLGLIVGAIGKGVALLGYQQALSIALGVLLILSSLAPAAARRFLPRLPWAGAVQSRVSDALGSLFRRRSVAALFLAGVLNGFLPCGFVVAGLAGAATTGSEAAGALFMSGFGAGTVPIMLGLSLAGYRLPAGFRTRLVAALPWFGVLLGVLLIVRGLGLGIPYLSPAAPSAATPHGGACH
jgi:sulfite exporter TauE/SafE